MNTLLKRKVDTYLTNWKKNPDRKPLIIKGARQIVKLVPLNGLPARIIKASYRLTL